MIPSILTALHFVALASAVCTTFTATSPLYYYYATSQEQAVSNGTICTEAANNNSQVPGGLGTCSYYPGSPSSNVTARGCSVSPQGIVSATGMINITGLSASEEASIYTLVGGITLAGGVANISYSNWTGAGNASSAFVGTGFSKTFSGCSDGSRYNLYKQCLRQGTIGHISAQPVLKCVNGTLSGCSGGPVQSGTGISICAVGVDYWNGPTERVGYPLSRIGFVNSTEAEARALAVNPAVNATCTKLYQSAAGRVERGWMMGCSMVIMGVAAWLAM